MSGCILKCQRRRECAACISAWTPCPPQPACGCISHLAALLHQSKSSSAAAGSSGCKGIATRRTLSRGKYYLQKMSLLLGQEIQLTPKATIFFAVFPLVPSPLQRLMQIFNEFVFLSLILVPAEIFFCTESNEVTGAFCFALFPSGINQCGLPSPSRQQE